MTRKYKIQSIGVKKKDKKPFVEFYNKHEILPVGQDITTRDFFYKRNFLYTTLGLPLSAFRDRDVIEFGPGGGYNAVATSSAIPSLYVFVDATRASIKELKRKKSEGLIKGKSVEIIESNIFDFKDKRTFDFVIIEGVVPTQTRPVEMIRHAASFVKKGGFLITTSTSCTSLLSEIYRRLFRPYIFKNANSFEERVSLAAYIFKPQLDALKTRTRSPEDWVLDNVLQKWEKKAVLSFPLTRVIKALGPSFEFLGSSPAYIVDDRFYKKCSQKEAKRRNIAYKQYDLLNLSLLDYRVGLLELFNIDKSLPKRIDMLCEKLISIHTDIIESNNYKKINIFLNLSEKLRKTLPRRFEKTIKSIKNFELDFRRFLAGSSRCEFKQFSKWWGRGQQYISFVKN